MDGGSDDGWASGDDDELLSQAYGDDEQEEQQEETQVEGATQVKDESEEPDDGGWESEDDEQLSQAYEEQHEAGHQERGRGAAAAPAARRPAAWVSPRAKLEQAMRAAGRRGWQRGSDSSSESSEEEGGRDGYRHVLVGRCAPDMLSRTIGAPRWRGDGPLPAAPPAEPARQEPEAPPVPVIGRDWSSAERHRFFRALRRCGKQPRKISERVGTKTPAQVWAYLQQLHAASLEHGPADEETAGEDEAGGGDSSTEDEAEAVDAEDCRWVRGACRPRRLRGRAAAGMRCPHWPGCEGEAPLPGRQVWAQTGWERLSWTQNWALRTFSLNNLARFLARKTNRHAYASFDAGAALELHAQLLALLDKILRAAALRAAQRLPPAAVPQQRGKQAQQQDAIALARSAPVIGVGDVGGAAALVDPWHYTASVVEGWARLRLPSNPHDQKEVFQPVGKMSAMRAQCQLRTVRVGGEQLLVPGRCVLPSAPPSRAAVQEAERGMRQGSRPFTELVRNHPGCFTRSVAFLS